MRKTYLLVILFAFINQPVGSQSIPWQQTSSTPGGSVWALVTIGNNLFAGTGSGGVYFSSDGGATWIQRNGAFAGMQVYSLTTNGNDIYAGCNYGYIYKSSDFGITWTDISPPNGGIGQGQVRALIVIGTDIYAAFFLGTGNGILKSPLNSINSASWLQFNTGLTQIDIRSLAFNGTKILAGTYGDGVWASETNSANWISSAGMQTGADYIQTLSVNGSNMFAGNISGSPVVYKSLNAGVSWTQSSTSIFLYKPVNAIIARGNSIYAGTDAAGICLSTDNGQTWNDYNNGFRDVSGNWYCSNFNIRSLFFAGDYLYAGTDCGVWKLHVPHDSTMSYLSGSVIHDKNANCQIDAGEKPLENWLVQAQHTSVFTNMYASTDSSGNYSMWVPPGTYSVSLVPKLYWNQVCPASPSTYSITIASLDTVSNLNFGAQISNFCPDPTVSIGTPLLRRCMKNNYSVQYWNNGTTTALKPLLRIDFDIPTGRIIPISSTLPWDSVSGKSYFWHIDSVKAGEYVSFLVLDSVSCSANLGDSLLVVSRISVPGDCNPKNNRDDDLHRVIGAYDPNEKLAYSGSNKIYRKQGVILPTDTISYSIHFQNTGSDTAFKVVVYDTLDAEVDVPSVVSGASSHSYTFELLGKGVLKWTFDNILLPDSNINEPVSHGFIKYRIRQKPGNPEGAVITNSAAIVFDFNVPVITKDNVLTVHTPVGISKIDKEDAGIHIYPNPCSGKFMIQARDIKISVCEIYNLLGERIYFEKAKGLQKLEIDISSEPPGVYFIKLNTNNGLLTKKVLLVR